jgi:hypothetical protein
VEPVAGGEISLKETDVEAVHTGFLLRGTREALRLTMATVRLVHLGRSIMYCRKCSRMWLLCKIIASPLVINGFRGIRICTPGR